MRGEEAKNSNNPRVSFLGLVWAFESVKILISHDNIVSSLKIIKAETSLSEGDRGRSSDIFRAHERLPLRMGKGWRRHRSDNVISLVVC